jgi:non-specific serine/threonine protein kinase/serine/threonine-protein kinase
VIHRDLKPSNVLVAIQDGKPIPKIIDFGVAKAIAQPLTQKTMFTELGQLIGTPAYMSPEQAEMTHQNVDTRTDVYSLGAVLYELLVGAPPFDPKILREAGFEGILKILRQDEPSKPSTRLSGIEEESTSAAHNRRTEPARLTGQLRGDLDWITMKALEKDRTRRYGSPSEFAADVGRHLRDEPVHARPPSAVYRGKKFLRRHRIAVTVGALSIIALVAFAAAMTWQARRVALERNRAEWVSKFLLSILLTADPSESRGSAVTVREVLDRGAARVENELSSDPVLQSRVMMMLGRTYEGLGLYNKAEELLEGALRIQRSQLGPYHRYTVASMHNLALVYSDLGRYADAEMLYREAIMSGRRGLGEKDPLTLTSTANLASVLQALGEYAEAESLHSHVLELRRQVRGREHLEPLSSAIDLALVWQAQGKYAEAERLIRGTLKTMTRTLGEDHPETLKAKHNLAVVLALLGRHAEAETIDAETLKQMRNVFGSEHPHTIATLMALSLSRAHLQRFGEAEALMLEALEIQRRVFGNDRPQTYNVLYNLGCIAAIKGERAEALAWLRQAVESGYLEAKWMLLDPDLEILRGDPELETLARRAEENAGRQRRGK